MNLACKDIRRQKVRLLRTAVGLGLLFAIVARVLEPIPSTRCV